MSLNPDSTSDPIARALDALERAEKAQAAAPMRRTAAEPGDTGEPGELEKLRAENESLRDRLSRADAEQARLRREAAQLAGRVDDALEQLNLIEKG